MLFNLQRWGDVRHGRAKLSDTILGKHLLFIFILSLIPKYDTTTSWDVPWAVTLPIAYTDTVCTGPVGPEISEDDVM